MSVGFDDKLLGEKAHYYCSSSEDEAEESDKSEDDGESQEPYPEVTMPDINDYRGYSTNTGPKGVINDWRRFKQLQTEDKLEQEREKIELGKKLTLTCRSEREDREAEAENEDLEKMFEDGFLERYRQKRIEEMKRALESLPKFGKVYELSKDAFVEAIDSEKPQVTVIVHLFEDGVPACTAMNGCLACLAQEYRTVKFCRIRASVAKLSDRFSATGVPALLVYKNKELISSFIRVQDTLGNDFFAVDVENFLLEHGLLPDKSLQPAHLISENNDGSGSDFELD